MLKCERGVCVDPQKCTSRLGIKFGYAEWQSTRTSMCCAITHEKGARASITQRPQLSEFVCVQ